MLASSPTLFTHGTAQRADPRTGCVLLPEAVHRITGKSAAIIGLKERGELREGWHADINVIDYENLSTCHPEYVNDFPHGGGRFVVKGKAMTPPSSEAGNYQRR